MPSWRNRSSQGGAPARLLSHIDELNSALVDFTCQLCAIPTVNPPGDRYSECVELLTDKLDAIGMSTRVVRAPRKLQQRLLPEDEQYPRDSVVARWDVGAPKTLHFNGHYDVVPATAGWKTDPFEPTIRGKRLIARGARDMKSSIAAAIFAVQAMKESGAQPPWNIELSFTPDEETGGELGLGYLVTSGSVRPEAAVVCEGSAGRDIGYAHRGVLWLDVTVLGEPAHACRPKHGINALEKACSLIAELKKLERIFSQRPTRFRTNKPSDKPPTLMIGGIAGGGKKTNVVPDRFHFTIDRRINPEEKVAVVERELRHAIRRAQQRDRRLKVKVNRLLYVAPGQTPLDADICRVAGAAVRSVRRQSPRYRLCLGFTDMHFLTQDAGVPTVMYGVRGGGEHSDLEWVALPELARTAKVYAEIAMRMPRP
ncbi:MAG: M20 family metallopeptidase [Armatimonadetes bacterium]|nr:M20 family metallopeptidase [Armatimonadota bacterium]